MYRLLDTEHFWVTWWSPREWRNCFSSGGWYFATAQGKGWGRVRILGTEVVVFSTFFQGKRK